MASNPGGAIAQPQPGIRLRTLANLRWIAVVGQLSTLWVVHYALGFPLALAPALALVGLSAALNLLLLRFDANAQLTGGPASFQLGFDLLQLVGLLYLSGGLENPFAVLLLVPVTISATILSLRSTVFLILLAIACLLLLSRSYLPLPWNAEPLVLSDTYLFGIWFALTSSMIFIAAYAWRVSAEARRRALALAATQAALAREQRLSALGGLAAAAAHELGTPLGTITLVAKELLREHGDDPVIGADLELLASQTARCRSILENLARRAGAEEAHWLRSSITALVVEAAQPYEGRGVAIVHSATAEDGGAAPIVARRPEILHGLGNFIENAVRFARSRVQIDLAWDDDLIHLVIGDDGPGFDAAILGTLGEPYLASQPGLRGEPGMGLGIFIAKTLLERTGAHILFLNDPDGGAVVDIHWRRSAIEEEGEAWQS